MKVSTLILMGLLMAAQAYSQQVAEEYDFIKPYTEIKNSLRKLPEKVIENTPYCSRMELMIDQASIAGKTDPNLKADRIVISKSRRKMYLLKRGQFISQHNVAFGFGIADGPKSQMADGRTPEGVYQVDFKKKRSNYNKALHISYPNEADSDFAAKNKVDPGGSIMIHGFPKQEIDGLDPILIPQIHPQVDWTQGCIAVTDREIEEIFEQVEEGTTVEICPLQENQDLHLVDR